jgi:hypothetical protein
MKSNRQRRAEILKRRKDRKAKAAARPAAAGSLRPPGAAPCDPEALAPYSSYGVPEFVRRGYYLDLPFQCRDCGKREVWTAERQQWWYEVAKGPVESGAVRCRDCRRAERGREAEARRAHREGLARRRGARG